MNWPKCSIANLLTLNMLLFGWTIDSFGIVADPTERQIQEALNRGEEVAKAKKPPNELYWQFGESGELKPNGFLMTHLSGIAVMSAHFALRAEKPAAQDIKQILEEDELQVIVTIFGSSPKFAIDSYLLMKQDDKLIKPVRIRSDARASRSSAWPNAPPYRAKVVASFPYDSFDSEAPTIISVFPRDGGEIIFELDFSAIP